MGQKGQIRDARCRMPEFQDFSSGAPRIRKHFMRQNLSVGVAACKADPAGILRAQSQRSLAMGEIADARSMQEKRGTCTYYSKHISCSIYTVIGHLQQEGSDQGLCGCSCCKIHLRYRHHLLGCGSNKQVIVLRSEGLEVPLGGSTGLGSASGGL